MWTSSTLIAENEDLKLFILKLTTEHTLSQLSAVLVMFSNLLSIPRSLIHQIYVNISYVYPLSQVP